MSIPQYDSIHRRGRTLEELYFAKRNHELRETLRRQLAVETAQRSLASALDTADDQILHQLVEIDSGTMVPAVLALLPMVEVAWSDGEVSREEQQAVFHAAEWMGVAANSPIYALLGSWLKQRPSAEVISAWRSYMRSHCATLSPESVARIKAGVLARAETIAFAAGGILGVGNKVSDEERTYLDELAHAFEK
jgi:hypothetical protein